MKSAGTTKYLSEMRLSKLRLTKDSMCFLFGKVKEEFQLNKNMFYNPRHNILKLCNVFL